MEKKELATFEMLDGNSNIKSDAMCISGERLRRGFVGMRGQVKTD